MIENMIRGKQVHFAWRPGWRCVRSGWISEARW